MRASTSVLQTNSDAIWQEHLGEIKLQRVVLKGDDKLGASETKKGVVVAPGSPVSGKNGNNCDPDIYLCTRTYINLYVFFSYVGSEQRLTSSTDEYHTMFSWNHPAETRKIQVTPDVFQQLRPQSNQGCHRYQLIPLLTSIGLMILSVSESSHARQSAKDRDISHH